MLKRAGYETAVTTENGLASNQNLFKLKRVRVKRDLSVEDFANLVE